MRQGFRIQLFITPCIPSYHYGFEMTTRRQAMGYVSFLSPFFLSCLIVLGMSIVPPFVIAETTTNMATVLEELSLFNPEAM